MGLYRDDGLAMVTGSGPQMDRLRKDIHKLFQGMKLDVTVETNLLITDYLDVTFNLNDGSFSPYSKPGNQIKYVSSSSNHPPHIKKQIPKMVQDRLSALSSNEYIFEREAPIYRKALHEAGYNDNIKYDELLAGRKKRKNRSRKIIWFRPPWSDTISTNIGAKFLKLVRKHFGKPNQLNKIFNKNSLKISYGCLPNIKSIISAQNRKNLSDIPTNTKQCNCRGGPTSCPVEGKCLSENVIYKVIVKSDDCSNIYIGSSQNFKERYNTHMSSFKLQNYKHATSLSSHVWSLKESNTYYTLKWSIIARANAYTPETKRCSLCLTEKAKILYFKGSGLLNKRSEIMSKCRHRAKHKLAAI